MVRLIVYLAVLSLLGCGRTEDSFSPHTVDPIKNLCKSLETETVTFVDSDSLLPLIALAEIASINALPDIKTLRTLDTAQSGIQLLQTGKFHGNEVKARSGEEWVGLFSTPEGFELLPTTIAVRTVHDPIVDQVKAVKTGKEVATNQKLKSILLIKGLSKVAFGTVKTIFSGRTKISLEGESVSLSLTGASREANFEDLYHISFKQAYVAGKQSCVLLIASQHFKIGDSCDRSSSPILLWAGDLDRDGKLDLLIDTSWHYNVSNPTLFLSSPASPQHQIEPVANFTTTGC